MKWIKGMAKPPRGFWVQNGTIELIPYGETGYDPNAVNVNLEEYYAALEDSSARYADTQPPLN